MTAASYAKMAAAHAAYLARRAAFADDEGLARKLAAATTPEARDLIEWLENLDYAGPLVRVELCALLDRGDDELTRRILSYVALKDPTTPLHARAVAAMDSADLGVRGAAISAVGMHGEIIPPALCDKIETFARDPDVGVRLAVVYSLGAHRASLAMAMLDDADEEVRYAAAHRLAHHPEHVDFAEACAEVLVHDRSARPSIRQLAAELFRSVARVRAAYELLAREGHFEAPEPGTPVFSGAPLRHRGLN